MPAKKTNLYHFLIILLAFSFFKYICRGIITPFFDNLGPQSDFAAFYYGAADFLLGENIYARVLQEKLGYAFPPLPVILFIPFTFFNVYLAKNLWLIINHGFLFVFFRLFLKTRKESSSILPISLAILLFNYQPLLSSLWYGQVNTLILLLIGAAFYMAKRSKDIGAGFFLASAAMIKLSPGFLIVYFLWKRNYKLVISALLSFSGMFLISVWLFGLNIHLVFAGRVIPKLSVMSNDVDQSIGAFFIRFLTIFNPLASPGKSDILVVSLSLVCSIFLLTAFLYLTRGGAQRDSSLFDLEYSFAIISFLLIHSVMWEQYLVWLLIPFFAILSYLFRSEERNYPVIILVALAYGIVAVRYGYDDPLLKRGIFRLLGSAKLYGTFLLWSAYACLLFRTRQASRKIIF